MDMKNKIEDVIEKIKNDKDLARKFVKDPVKTVENLLGVDLPDEQVKQAVKAIKAKIDFDDIGDKLDDIGDKLGDIGDKIGDKLGDLLGKK